MAIRIAGRNLNENKRAPYALAAIYGVGIQNAKTLLEKFGVDATLKLKEIGEKEIGIIREYIEKTLVVEGDLKRQIVANIQRLKGIKAYRGIRHQRGLPVRGQRTKTNSRTVRGNTRKTMGSGRKGAPSAT